ncbi:MAG: hypothetical protein HDS99_04680 [Bacteroidales bacterium]|nr:hypothetical protein [Bacteroidales bacterium]
MKELVAISICVILPIVIVWITTRCRIHAQNKRTEVLMEALKVNPNVDVQKLIDGMSKRQLTPAEAKKRNLSKGVMFTLMAAVFIIVPFITGSNNDDLNDMLIAGGILLSIGIANLVVFFFGNKHVKEA